MPTLPIHIYIVDDEPSITTAYARLMRSAKMNSRTFSSVEDLLRADFSDERACVICDLQMPGAGGIELPGLLAQAGHRVPVIFVTAHDTPETREMAQQAGASGYFRKPVDDQALLDAIEWALSTEPASPKERTDRGH
ncbi:MAG: response regulator transcription factor [Chthoniobacteraceae bacterium]